MQDAWESRNGGGVVQNDVRFRTFLRAFHWDSRRIRWYLPMALLVSTGYILKSGFVDWLILVGCTLAGVYVVFAPVGYAIWRRRRLRGLD